ncbi:1-deoxy-D-xylulose-5-phosphate synthase [bacterium]|nr:1-deoxy-D-xylulose-5-phosphate synthase [bacterium]MBU1072760.1 1-deoxy-D-xylulose-5-phosphate synthase [bacterium]MBU1675148.1 1-deoxy-D-xylulose-5-phosphate synthase [bacterium]
MTSILHNLTGPEDLAHLSPAQLEGLCGELRDEIISTVATTGGHLGASLGVVELTVALHHLFHSPADKIIWDVGHQAYGHKLLTGRRERFDTLRQEDGISGFPKRSENPHDAYGVGHASTSISAALGFAKARDLKGEGNAVIAVIGDGALTGGLAYEGLNNAGQTQTDLIVVLNDNEMSISPNVGAIAKYLTRITSGQLYTRFEADLWRILGRFPRGKTAQKLAGRIKDGLKQIIVPTILFEELGFKYFGPIDGHDLPLLVKTLDSVRKLKGPVLVHAVTRKGKGYSFAENDRPRYHGVGKFDRKQGLKPSDGGTPSYTSVFGRALVRAAETDDRIVAITAAMPEGTGLDLFRDAHPDRFFDVGIAEQHAVTFACGLACEGLKPVVAIYSTFLQRAYDQIIHDAALQKLPVVFAIDRAGVVGEDGPTHHGSFDLTYLRAIPDLVIMAPKDEHELRRMLVTCLAHEAGPTALRYPRGAGQGVPLPDDVETLAIGKGEPLRRGDDVCLLAVGSMVAPSVEAARRLAEAGVEATVVNMRFVKPLDEEILQTAYAHHRLVVTLEENTLAGGFGAAVLEWAAMHAPEPVTPTLSIGIPDQFMAHAPRSALLTRMGLDADTIAERVLTRLNSRDGVRARSAGL